MTRFTTEVTEEAEKEGNIAVNKCGAYNKSVSPHLLRAMPGQPTWAFNLFGKPW